MSNNGQLPTSWAVSSLGEICSKPQYGWTTPADPNTGTVKLLRTTDITSGDVNWNTVPYCTEEPPELSKYQLAPDDIVISRAGSVGASYRLRDVPDRAVFASYLIRFRPLSPIDPSYVASFLESSSYWSSITDKSAGIAVPNVNAKKLETIELPIAPTSEQTRIAAKLDELFSDLDAGVSALERARANLKRYRAAVLKAAVEGRLTAEWRKAHPDVEPASKLLERILAERRRKWEEAQLAKFAAAGSPSRNWQARYKPPVSHEQETLPEIPSEWTWISLGTVAWEVRDGPHYSPKYVERGIPFISGGNVRAEGIDFSATKYISEELHQELSKRCKPEYGDLLYTKGGTTGIARINWETRDFNVWVHVAVLKLVQSIDKRYLQHVLNSPFCFSQSQRYTHGVGNQDLGLTRMVKIALPLPPLKEQTAIADEVDRRLSVISVSETDLEHESRRSYRLRQAILKRAFEGKLVPQDLNDEPASVLLERIRTTRAASLPQPAHKRRKSPA